MPITVTLEKLFPVLTFVDPVTELPPLTWKVTVPPVPVLLKVPTIELLEIVLDPPATSDVEALINVTLPVVLAVIFVNLLSLILTVRGAFVAEAALFVI